VRSFFSFFLFRSAGDPSTSHPKFLQGKTTSLRKLHNSFRFGAYSLTFLCEFLFILAEWFVHLKRYSPFSSPSCSICVVKLVLVGFFLCVPAFQPIPLPPPGWTQSFFLLFPFWFVALCLFFFPDPVVLVFSPPKPASSAPQLHQTKDDAHPPSQFLICSVFPPFSFFPSPHPSARRQSVPSYNITQLQMCAVFLPFCVPPVRMIPPLPLSTYVVSSHTTLLSLTLEDPPSDRKTLEGVCLNGLLLIRHPLTRGKTLFRTGLFFTGHFPPPSSPLDSFFTHCPEPWKHRFSFSLWPHP